MCVCGIAVMSFTEPVTHRQPREILMVFSVVASEGRITLGPTTTSVRLCRCEDVFFFVCFAREEPHIPATPVKFHPRLSS